MALVSAEHQLERSAKGRSLRDAGGAAMGYRILPSSPLLSQGASLTEYRKVMIEAVCDRWVDEI